MDYCDHAEEGCMAELEDEPIDPEVKAPKPRNKGRADKKRVAGRETSK